jgi:hypothetical protein
VQSEQLGIDGGVRAWKLLEIQWFSIGQRIA